MRESRIRVLVLHSKYTNQISYYDDWLDALKSHRGFRAVEFDIAHSPRELEKLIGETDAIVALHSTNGDTTHRIQPHIAVLSARRVPLISFVGNEFNLPGTPIAAKRRVFEQIRPQWIATQLLQEAGQFLFGDVADRGVVSLPHGLNAAAFQPVVASEDRKIDIGSRVARYLPHLGDNDRNRIADQFIGIARENNLKVDISAERFDRAGWASFLNRCKGTVSCEAGSWFIERDDATVDSIREYIKERAPGFTIANDSSFLRISRGLPDRFRQVAARMLSYVGVRHEHNTHLTTENYLDIHARFFAGRPKPDVNGKCISSRHLDAAGTKTCQIMFRGRFNDILEPDRHYLAVDFDFGNLGEILRRFNDKSERAAITEAAYELVMRSHTYEQRMYELERLLRGS